MKIDEIIEMWQKDAIIDDIELDRESLNIPILHGKYLKIYYNEKLKGKAIKIQYKTLSKVLSEYYRGDLNNAEDLEELGREPWGKTVLKQDISQYIEGDPQMIKLVTKMVYQEEVISLLADIMRSINTRGFSIKSAIDWRKLTNFGVM
jgi:hypothetical protein|tara:strand:+ start:423 stop:866 length:444 start_codon:yes stop_codon:yes gene_type:complete